MLEIVLPFFSFFFWQQMHCGTCKEFELAPIAIFELSLNIGENVVLHRTIMMHCNDESPFELRLI